jgi:PPP family 3-phenylpropionic acid transporter
LSETIGAPAALGREGWQHASNSVRAGYFWAFAAVGAFGPFTTIYYRELGFSGLEVGVLAALPALCIAFTGPIWGSIADALSAHRVLIRNAISLAALIALAVTRATTFVPILILIGLLALATTPVASFLDGYAVAIGERLGPSYGSLRVWGSIGYTAAVFTVGRIMGDQVDRTFIVAYAACWAVTLLTTIGLPRLGERHARPLFSGFGAFRRNRPLMVLLATSYLVTSATAILNGFLGIRIKELGGGASLVGVAIALGAISELPVLAFGSWFLRRIGAPNLIAIAIAVYSLRLAVYGLITAPSWILPFQALHGLSYGAFLTASVLLAHRFAGREHAATAQTLLGAFSFGLGSITGSLVGGALLDAVGSAWLFRGAAMLMIMTLVAYLLFKHMLDPEEVGPLSFHG